MDSGSTWGQKGQKVFFLPFRVSDAARLSQRLSDRGSETRQQPRPCLGEHVAESRLLGAQVTTSLARDRGKEVRSSSCSLRASCVLPRNPLWQLYSCSFLGS